MKIFIATVVLFTVACADPPPSHSYLPPPPSSRGSTGYPQGGPGGSGQSFTTSLPQIIAARSLESRGVSGANGNGFTSAQGAIARFANEEPGYDQNAGAFGKNGLDDVSSESASYNFGYMVNDYQGTDFGHHEERLEDRALGEYHVVLPDGRRQTVSYEADERGYKPQISYEDTEDFARSGHHGNAGGNGY